MHRPPTHPSRGAARRGGRDNTSASWASRAVRCRRSVAVDFGAAARPPGRRLAPDVRVRTLRHPWGGSADGGLAEHAEGHLHGGPDAEYEGERPKTDRSPKGRSPAPGPRTPQRPTGQPVRCTIATISPSRGPGPRWAPRYSAEPAATAATFPAVASRRTSTARPPSQPSVSSTSMVPPTTTTSGTVPIPGRTRRAIPTSSTSADTAIDIIPNGTSRCSENPPVRTDHGPTPSSATSPSHSPAEEHQADDELRGTPKHRRATPGGHGLQLNFQRVRWGQSVP